MDRIQELLGKITDLSDDELNELKDLILQEMDADAQEPNEPADAPAAAGVPVPAGMSTMATATETPAGSIEALERLADAADAVSAEKARRAVVNEKRAGLRAKLDAFRGEKPVEVDAAAPAVTEQAGLDPAAPVVPAVIAGKVGAKKVVPVAKNAAVEDEELTTDDDGVTAAVVPADRKPQRQVARTTVIRAGADLPGIAMGAELDSPDALAMAMVKRIQSMRGIRGGDGDKLIVASASLDGVPEQFRLGNNEAEENLRKVLMLTSPNAITAAGGLGAPEETKYDLFGIGDTDRPVRSSLPVFTTERGGIRFMRPPTLNDVAGVIGIWTVANDIAAATDSQIRKPSFRVLPGPEIVVDTQAITMILTFGNMMSRAYPELVKRHNELALVAHARVAEQQLLTQIGALSTAVSGRTQKLGAIREVLAQVDQASASYRNRHRINAAPLACIMPVWFLNMLRADIASQHPGDGLEIFNIADAQIQTWFSSRNIKITWAMDGEAGQDYAAITDGATPAKLAPYPTTCIWYLFAEGTFAFMDGGTLDLGLVRDSTLNAANDYQMFVETFENIVKFGHQSLRVTSTLTPTGQGSADVSSL
jgi:hypothetical protein